MTVSAGITTNFTRGDLCRDIFCIHTRWSFMPGLKRDQSSIPGYNTPTAQTRSTSAP